MLNSIGFGCAGLRSGWSFRSSAIALVALVAAIPAHAQHVNWTGSYAGLHAGGGWGNGDTNIVCDDSAVPALNCAGAVSSGSFVTSMSPDPAGFIGGGQVGYNYQTGNIVLGVETDISWTSIDGSDTAQTAPAGFAPFTSYASQDLNWFGTVRGRLGYAVDSWLVYATGGLAYGKVDYNYAFTYIPPNSGFGAASDSKMKAGWTVGGGAEYDLGHWSIRGEYLYYDLGDETLSASIIQPATGPTGGFARPQFETRGSIVRAAVNFDLN